MQVNLMTSFQLNNAVSVSYDSPMPVSGECGLCYCCSNCVLVCQECVGEQGKETNLETLLRVLQVPDFTAARLAMDVMAKEAKDEKAEYDSSEEDEEQEEEEEEEEDEDEEPAESDISGSDFD